MGKSIVWEKIVRYGFINLELSVTCDKNHDGILDATRYLYQSRVAVRVNVDF